ncbi:hypothetical protein SAMN02745866_01129 [Alteromonadaceae bacterium Bs31]|nr:hypothetical protein SAMN02745866_01129 [Alteromonadaceae bacterium Bs31]
MLLELELLLDVALLELDVLLELEVLLDAALLELDVLLELEVPLDAALPELDVLLELDAPPALDVLLEPEVPAPLPGSSEFSLPVLAPPQDAHNNIISKYSPQCESLVIIKSPKIRNVQPNYHSNQSPTIIIDQICYILSHNASCVKVPDLHLIAGLSGWLGSSSTKVNA